MVEFHSAVNLHGAVLSSGAGKNHPALGDIFHLAFGIYLQFAVRMASYLMGEIIMNRQMLFRYIIIFIGIVLLAKLTSCFETSTVKIVNREEIEDQRREAERKAELEAKFRRPSFVRPKLNLGK